MGTIFVHPKTTTISDFLANWAKGWKGEGRCWWQCFLWASMDGGHDSLRCVISVPILTFLGNGGGGSGSTSVCLICRGVGWGGNWSRKPRAGTKIPIHPRRQWSVSLSEITTKYTHAFTGRTAVRVRVCGLKTHRDQNLSPIFVRADCDKNLEFRFVSATKAYLTSALLGRGESENHSIRILCITELGYFKLKTAHNWPRSLFALLGPMRRVDRAEGLTCNILI